MLKWCSSLLEWSWPQILWAGAIIYGITAWYTAGYFHPDEHFQILEFANWKLGGTPSQDLAWEFGDRIRPALQPVLAFIEMRALNGLGLHNPFFQVWMLRIWSAFLSLFLYFGLCRMLDLDEKWRKMLFWCCLLIWFVPMLSVRFSSENWSAICWLSAALMLLSDRISRGQWALIGALLGFSFCIRYQMAFALLGIGAWLWWIKQPGYAAWIWLLLGGCISLAIGFMTDYWFYGEWVCAPWNYFTRNILEHKAAEYGVAPWWYYVPSGFVNLVPPISIFLLVGMVWGMYKRPHHLFTWAFVPFFLGHSIVAHKELRFLFPMMFVVLYFAVVGWQDLMQNWGQKRLLKGVIGFTFGLNMLLWVYFCTQPLQTFMPYFSYLYHQANQHSMDVYTERESPYKLVDVQSFLYGHPNIRVHVVHNLDSLAVTAQPGDLFLYRRLKIDHPVPHARLELAYTFLPAWIEWLNINHWQERSHIWSIYRIYPEK
jgi:phosphatidylinositol glycan class B